MSFEKSHFPDYPRRELREHIRKIAHQQNSTMPSAAQDEIVDLACHAAATARDAAFDVLSRASHPAVANTAVGLAFSLIAMDCENMQEVLEKYAAENGKPMIRTTLQVGGQDDG